MEVKPGYKQTDVGVIPEDWSVVDYVSFGVVIDGDRGSHYPSVGDLRDSGFCLFLNAGNVTKEGFRFIECQFISLQKDRELNKGKLVRHDVVLTTRGTVGNLAYFGNDIAYDQIRINSGMVILRNRSSAVANAYQYLVLASRIVKAQIERLSFGSAQPQLTVKGISTLKIPFPPTKAEQQAIAGALSDADALIESLGQLIAKKRNIKKGAMQELLTGKRQLTDSKWKQTELKNEAKLITKGTTPTSYNRPFVEQGINFFKAESFAEDGSLQDDKVAFIDTQTHTFLQRSQLQHGDILFSIAGALGRTTLVHRDWLPANINQALALIRLKKNSILDQKYLSMFLSSHEIQSEIVSISVQAAQPNLSLADVGEFVIHHPEMPEQKAITRVLSSIGREIKALEEKLHKARQIKQGMMQELLTGRIRLV